MAADACHQVLTREPHGALDDAGPHRREPTPPAGGATSTHPQHPGTAGATTDGTPNDSTAIPGAATDGTATDGSATDSTAIPGAATDGHATDSTATPGAATGGASFVPRLITGLLIVGPVVAVALAVPLLWGRAIHPRDLVLAATLYLVTGFGVTVGFHRLFTHRGFRPKRPLKIALAIAGSMAVEGSLISWVANHRRHHVRSDRSGDPHSPHVAGERHLGPVRGFVHAHVGWLFAGDPVAADRYAADLTRDRDIVLVSTLFPVWAVASLALPFAAGWLWSGSLLGGLTAFIWAGLVRMALLHHITWSVNSICHMIGTRPFVTDDQSRNVAPLAVVSFGESWHNLHHAYPHSARHGVGQGERDPSARVIRWFEQAGWATDVQWPTPDRLAALAAPVPSTPHEGWTERPPERELSGRGGT